MPGIYDVTPTTFNRPNDRLPEDLDGQLFQKFVGEYDGQIWFVNHKLKSTNLLVEFWKDNNPHAYWWDVDVIDYENIQVQWNMPVRGRAVIYAVRDFVGVSKVYEQGVPALEWTIEHNFGTRDILIDVWIDGTLLVPEMAEGIDLDTTKLTFATPVAGKAVLMVIDPAISPYVTVDWNHIVNKPATFPPDVVPVGTADDALMLGGQQPAYYLNIDQLGKTVAPLEVELGTGKNVIPLQHLPNRSNMRFRDHANAFTATEVYIDDENSPLRMQYVKADNRIVLSTAFLVRKIRLLDSEPNPNYPNREVEASSEFLVRLKAGAGIALRQIDLNTLEIVNKAGTSKRFTVAALPVGLSWDVIDPIFQTPGDYFLQLYTTQFDPTIQTAFSNHVYGSPTFNETFAATGDKLMVLNGNRLEVGVNAIANHFVYQEHYVSDGFADVDAPWGALGIWVDETNDRFVMGVQNGPTYTFYGLDMSTASMTPIVATNSADIPGPVCLNGAYIYAVKDTGGKLELVSTNFASFPAVSWTTETLFATVPYPTVGTGILRIRITGAHLFILNTRDNSLSGYARATGMKLWSVTPEKPIKDFDVWPDEYISISLATESSLWVTNAPAITTTPPVFAPSIDKLMGGSRLFAFGFGGAMGIMPNDKFWRAETRSMVQRTIYEYGEQTLWLKGSYAWTVSNFWAVVTSMKWASIDTLGFSEAKIAFYPGKTGSMPDTLYRWNGLTFDAFPASDFPALGQDLSIVDTMTVLGGQELSYAFYFKRDADQWLNPAFVEQNFECKFQGAGLAMLTPISGDGRTGTIKVTCAPNQVTVTNNSEALMEGLKLLATPVA